MASRHKDSRHVMQTCLCQNPWSHLIRLELALLLAPCLLLLDLLLYACQLSLQLLPRVRVFHALQVQPVFSDGTTFSFNAQSYSSSCDHDSNQVMPQKAQTSLCSAIRVQLQPRQEHLHAMMKYRRVHHTVLNTLFANADLKHHMHNLGLT